MGSEVETTWFKIWFENPCSIAVSKRCAQIIKSLRLIRVLHENMCVMYRMVPGTEQAAFA